MASYFATRPVGPMLVAAAAAAAVLATLLPDRLGPGVTCDEYYHVSCGKELIAAARHQGLAFFRPDNIRRNFPWTPDGPPVQAPLGQAILGGVHHLFDPKPDDPKAVSVGAARFAPALAFGLLVLLVGLWTARLEGHLAGTAAAAAVALVPRVFAHAHLAALDMLTTFFFVAAVLAVAVAVRGDRWWHFALAGCVWGLAMLVRLHGTLPGPPIAVWLLWQYGRKAWRPILAWGAAGIATLYAGWPWLWLAPVANLRQYLVSGAGRQAIHVFYAGRVWADHDAPWHYPAVMFVVALPLGLLLLGLMGTWTARRDWNARPHLILVGGVGLFVLSVFAWPGVPVYDGVRLFLMAFPLWAVFVGVGASWLVEHRRWQSLSRRVRLIGLGLFLAAQGVGLVVYHPCQLSHYSLAIGGLAGAERLGFEVTYWGDSVREPILGRAAALSPGQPILLAPHLAPWQADSITFSSSALAAHESWLVGWDPNDPAMAAGWRYSVVYHRRADLAALGPDLLADRVVWEYSLQGVWLTRLVEHSLPATGSVGGAAD